MIYIVVSHEGYGSNLEFEFAFNTREEAEKYLDGKYTKVRDSWKEEFDCDVCLSGKCCIYRDIEEVVKFQQ